MRASAIDESIGQAAAIGSEKFIRQFLTRSPDAYDPREVPRRQRRLLKKSLDDYAGEFPDRNEAMAQAALSGDYTLKEIADYYGVHYSTVSRAARKS